MNLEKIKKYILLLFMGIFCVQEGYGQDPFFSQFYNAPLVLNPALTGISFGKVRTTFNYKNYLNDFDQIQTYSFAIDMSLLEPDRNPDFAGIGFLIVQDNADQVVENTRAMISYSYHNAFGRRGKNYISMGLQAGIDHVKLDYSSLSTQSQWVPFQGYDPSLSNGENFAADSKTVLDFQAGLLYYSFLRNNTVLFFGVSAFHLSAPDRSLLGQESRLSRKYLVHGGGKFPLTKKLNFVPTMVFFMQDNIGIFNPGMSIEYELQKARRFTNQKSATISIGGWVRNTDAFIAGLSLEYGDFNAGVSYDLILSSLSRASRDGGFEISMSYSFNKKFRTRTKLISNPSPRL